MVYLWSSHFVYGAVSSRLLVGFPLSRAQPVMACCGEHSVRHGWDMLVVDLDRKIYYEQVSKSFRRSSRWVPSTYKSYCRTSDCQPGWILVVQIPAMFLRFVSESDCASRLDSGQNDALEKGATQLVNFSENCGSDFAGN